MADCTSLTLGYIVSIVAGGIIVFPVWWGMWRFADGKGENPLKAPHLLAIIQGAVERGLYTSCIVLGRPDGIAVWLAFKAIMRVKVPAEDPRNVAGTEIFLVGTAISLAFGVLGGMIAIKIWSLK